MKLVILDRDGVINYDSDQFIKHPDEWKPIPGSLDAIAKLNHAGYTVVVATNQSGIGRGLFEMSTLVAIHEKLQKMLSQAGGRIDAIFYCPHTADVKCGCRKPEAGMLVKISERFETGLAGVPAIGDSLRDLVAASRVGAAPILVLTGKGSKTLENGNLPEGTKVFADLAEAAQYLAG
ncbi:MAG: D-glycero-beta-D-manno-heptose 1,7-bisphosphate 7-phosphatase [Burkholderiales bacterium]|nr:D-glycero-beta-D-manno-heptose 1,7-bisphosphate 7-phosphatase [Burkholderiales bacterium]